MRFTNESAFTRWMCDDVFGTCGARTFAIVASAMQEAGWPDRYLSHRCLDLWFESKKDERQLTTSQRLVITSLLQRETAALEMRLDSSRGVVSFLAPGLGEVADFTVEWL
jgi:hypothetical protein